MIFLDLNKSQKEFSEFSKALNISESQLHLILKNGIEKTEYSISMDILKSQNDFDSEMNSIKPLIEKFNDCISDLENLSNSGYIQGYEDSILEYRETINTYK
jgi:hypothetical protein